MAVRSVTTSIENFLVTNMIAYQMIPRTEFDIEINATLSRLQTMTPVVFGRTLDLIRVTLQGNALMDLFSSTWKLAIDNNTKGRNASFYSIPVKYDIPHLNTSCTCSKSRSCVVPAQRFYNSTPYYTFEGLMHGCFLLESILRSSLSCFYSVKCIDELRENLGVRFWESIEEWSHRTGHPGMMNALATRFSVNDTVETLVYNMFIETWNSNVSYEMFFDACEPKQCTYTYHYRFDAMEVFTTFLSVFGGLSAGLHFIIPHFVQIIQNIVIQLRRMLLM